MTVSDEQEKKREREWLRKKTSGQMQKKMKRQWVKKTREMNDQANLVKGNDLMTGERRARTE